jgi:hypothetical protein
MLRNLSCNIQFTSIREQVVFPNQIYINLHSRNEVGCIVKGKDSLILDSVYYNPNAILQNIDIISSGLTVFSPPEINLDYIFSFYVIEHLFKKGIVPEKRIYDSLKYIINSEADQSHYINFHSVFLAIKKLNDEQMTIKKVISILDSLEPNQEESLKQNTLCMHLKFEGLSFLQEELNLIKNDYHKYCCESKNSTMSQTDLFLVLLTNGKLASVPGMIYKKKTSCNLLDYWLKLDGYGIFINIKSTDKGSNVCIKKVNSEINLQNLSNCLTFFEFYLTKGQSNQKWRDEGKIFCEQTQLSKDEIIDILEKFTEPWVNEQKVKYVFPFHFDYTKYKDIAAYLDRKFVGIDEAEMNHKFMNTFLPLFNDYLFNNEDLSKKQTHSNKFIFQKTVYATVEGKKVNFNLENNSSINPLFTRKFDVEIRQFRYGVGFLILNSSFTSIEEVPLSYVLDVDKHICSKVQDVFRFFFGGKQEIKTNATRRGIVYESIEIHHESFVKERKENIVLKTCSANKRTYISDPDELREELAEKFLSRGDFVFYGFSRSCGVQFIVDNALLSKKGLNTLTENFLNEKFYIFLFAIQQRDAIRQFSDKLVGSSITKRKLKASRIRKDFLEFMTQVKLSHISDHNVVTRFYNRWRTIFDSESIFLELSEKLTALDGYQQSKVSYHFNFISFIVFPIVALSSLFTMGIFKTNAIEIDLVYVILSNIALILVFFLFSWKR